jgi:hypothetical protein
MAERGHIVLALLFLLLLSVSGLALLTATGLHLKIIAARKDKRLAAAASESRLVLELHRYREKLAAADMNAFPEPESGFFNRGTFPDVLEGGYASRHQFGSFTVSSGDGFRVVRILDLVQVSGGGSRLSFSGRAGVDLFQGSFAASEPGLLVARHSAEAPAAFLAGRGVEYSGSTVPLVGDVTLVQHTGLLLGEALGLPGQVPDWRRIREKFDLEPSSAPIPPGAYPVRDGEEVAAVFVQGDLEKLEFAANGDRETIVFCQGGRCCELSYVPGQGSLAWGGGDAAAIDGARFRERIIVHGSVWDIRQAGSAAFLPAARIELLACGRLVVRTGLESENLALGREKFPGLLLMTSGSDFFSGEAVDADVVIAAGGAQTVQAQVVAAGALVNEGNAVEITGSLVAGDIENSGRVRVDAVAGDFAFDDYVRLPDCKFLKNFRVHFIQEGDDE